MTRFTKFFPKSFPKKKLKVIFLNNLSRTIYFAKWFMRMYRSRILWYKIHSDNIVVIQLNFNEKEQTSVSFLTLCYSNIYKSGPS